MRTITVRPPEINRILNESGDRKIVLLEGIDDLDVLEKWYKDKLSDIYFHDCGGKDKLKIHFDYLKSNSTQDKIFGIRDRDLDFTDVQVENCYSNPENRYFILRKRNLENYLISASLILEFINIYFPRTKRPVKTESEVERVILKIIRKAKCITLCNSIIQDENDLILDGSQKTLHFSEGHPVSMSNEVPPICWTINAGI